MSSNYTGSYDKKRRMTNKKNTKLTYNQPLAKNPKNTQVRTALALEDKKEELEKQRGRKSYAEIAIEKGVYQEIADTLQEWVRENPFYNQKELMEFMQAEYSEVFGGYKSKYAGNFYKIIEKEELWKDALSLGNVQIERAVLRNLHKRAVKGLREEVDHKGNIYEVGMSDRDAINYIRLLHELDEYNRVNNSNIQELQLEQLKNKNKLLEAQIAKLKGNDTDDAYIKGFITDLDQIDNE